MPSQSQVAASKAIQRRTGKTFHVATRFLPPRVRRPTYVLYGFFRVADEVVDDPGGASPAEQRRELAAIREAVLGSEEPEDPVLAAFREVRAECGIDPGEVDRFLDAMAQDATKARYDTFEELHDYMRGSAVAVANMMTSVMAPENPDIARPHARALGEAFQLTNFVRDVREDVLDRNRVYLPRELLAAHGVTFDQLTRLEMSGGVAEAVREALARTEALYERGVAGIRFLPPDCRFPVVLSAVLYADHHRLVRANDYDVVTTRPSLSTRRKLSLVARTGARWLPSRDPRGVFHRVRGVQRGRASAHPHVPDPTA